VTDKKKVSPWVPGIIDTLVGARVLLGTTIPHRNRLAVILMDTAFETACRAFLKHRKRFKLTDAHRSRETLVKATRGNLKDIDDAVWESIAYYYEEIRNDLYHESAGRTITDTALLDYQDTVEFVIGRALNESIDKMVSAEAEELRKATVAEPVQLGAVVTPGLRDVSNRVDKVIVGIAAIQPRSAEELNEYFKREGDGLRVKAADFTNIVARNRGSKRFFYYSKEQKTWMLSAAGHFKLSQIGSTEAT
jgi:DNA-directed RNA polymerase subunit F